MSKLDDKDLDLAKRVGKVRRFKGYSEEYMAQKLGMSQRQYSRYETGEQLIPAERLAAICVVLEVEENDLRNFDERMSFAHCNGILGVNNHNTYHAASEKERELYETTISHLREEVTYLRNQLEAALGGGRS